MEPLTDVRQISKIAYGYMASQTLFAALEFGLFSLLSRRPKSEQEIADETGVAVNRMQTVLSALVSNGLLTRGFIPSPWKGRKGRSIGIGEW